MTTIAAPAVLDVQGVSKRFAGVLALADVSIELRAGQVHALVGENGAGKSTLIKVLTGVHQPDDGSIVYRGQTVSFARPLDAQAAGISTIYQEVNLVPLMSVARNLFLGREPITRLGLIDFGRMHREANASLARYGIHVDVRRPLRQLGLGVQQMVAIARAIDADHRVVIMDEPTSSLEPREVERLMEVVDLLRRDGVAVVYVSHRLDEVFRLCDVVTVLRDGRRVHTGPIAQITRLELVSKMLGRELSEVARARTRFGCARAQPVISVFREHCHLASRCYWDPPCSRTSRIDSSSIRSIASGLECAATTVRRPRPPCMAHVLRSPRWLLQRV